AGGNRASPRAGAPDHSRRRAHGESGSVSLPHRHGDAPPHQRRRRHHRDDVAPRAGASAGLRPADHRPSRWPRGPRRPAGESGARCRQTDLRRGPLVSRAERWTIWLFVLAAFIWSAWATELSARRMVEGMPFMVDFMRRMVPPDVSVLGNAVRGAVQTLEV